MMGWYSFYSGEIHFQKRNENQKIDPILEVDKYEKGESSNKIMMEATDKEDITLTISISFVEPVFLSIS